jgi:hypothetical protein
LVLIGIATDIITDPNLGVSEAHEL